jgi:hypothetical protein
MVPPCSQNTVGACNEITLLILYCISSGLLSLLKVTDAPIQVYIIYHQGPSITSVKVHRYNNVLLPIILINVTLAKLKCKLPDDGHRLKHIGAILV